MSADDAARQEAERRYRDRAEFASTPGAVRNARTEAFERGAKWQREQPVSEVAVRAAAWTLYASECRRQGIEPVKQQHEPGWSEAAWTELARAALEAAKGARNG